MIALNSGITGNTWHNSFTATGEPCHGVVDNATGYDDLVGSNNMLVKIGFYTTRSFAHIDKVGSIRSIALDELNTAYCFLAIDCDIFLVGMFAVGTKANNEGDVVVRDAGTVQFV